MPRSLPSASSRATSHSSGNATATPAQYRGCLLGGAIGDALGAPIEFDSLAKITQRFGPAGLRNLESAYGRIGAITDDTQMTLFTAEGILRAKHRKADKGFVDVPEVLRRAYWRWLSTQGVAAPKSISDGFPGWLVCQKFLHTRRAPDNTCVEALTSGRLLSTKLRLNDSKGCGGMMRVAPIGLAKGIDPFDIGCEAAAITHGHRTGFLAAGVFAQVIADIARGRGLEAAVDRAVHRLERVPGHAETLTAISKARRLAQKAKATPAEVESLGEGRVADQALAIGLFAALAAKDFEHGVLLAVNHGGDSDSTGSIAGNILGLQLGEGAIPGRWLRKLEGRKVIAEVASDLWRTFVSKAASLDIPEAMFAKYPPN